jgi:hypothetical protein
MRQRHAPALLAYQRIPLVRGTRTRGKLRKRVTRQDAYSYWPITLVRGDESLRAAPRAPYIRLSPSFIATSTAVLFLLYDRTRLIWQRGTQRESRNSREGVKSRKGESRKRIMHVSIAVMRRSVSPLLCFTVSLLDLPIQYFVCYIQTVKIGSNDVPHKLLLYIESCANYLKKL